MRIGGAALAGVVTLSACFPVMAHPTRVESGMRLGTVAGFSFGSDSIGETGQIDPVIVPSLDIELALGIRDTTREDGPGLRLSAAAGMSGFGGSVYVEYPRESLGSLDGGVGLAAHRGALRVIMPYAQFGRHEDRDRAWFVRNGIAIVAPRDSAGTRLAWIPTVGFSTRDQRSDKSIYLSAVFGGEQRVERACVLFSCLRYSNSYTRTTLIVGASISLLLSTPGYPGDLGRPPRR